MFGMEIINGTISRMNLLKSYKIIVFIRRLFSIKILQMKLIYQQKKKLENGDIKNYTKKLQKFALKTRIKTTYTLLPVIQAQTIPKHFF